MQNFKTSVTYILRMTCTFRGTFTLFTPCSVKKPSNCTHFDFLTTFTGLVQGSGTPGLYNMNPALKDYTLFPDSVVEVDFLDHITFRASFDKSALRNVTAVSGYCSISQVLAQD